MSFQIRFTVMFNSFTVEQFQNVFRVEASSCRPLWVHSKKCWVKYNPAVGKIWTNPAIGLFRPSGWVTAQKVGLNI